MQDQAHRVPSHHARSRDIGDVSEGGDRPCGRRLVMKEEAAVSI